VVVPAVDVRDAEIGVVDHACEVIRRAAVVPQELDPFEAIRSEALCGLPIAFLAPALADRALVPLEAEPADVLEDRLFTAGHVPSGVGVVDPEQEPVSLTPVDDGAESVPDVE
jgi:hypothetical protein